MTNNNQPQLRFPGFDNEWEYYNMGELYTERKEKGNEQLQMLTVSIHTGVSDGELDEEDLGKAVKRSEDKSVYKHVYSGDLVFNMMRAWQGAIGVVKKEGMISPAYISAIPNDKIFPLFMDYAIRRKKSISQINDLSYGVTDFRKRLYWDSFEKVTCSIPSVEEQYKIWSFFRTIDDEINLHQRGLDNIKEYKSGMIQKMFPKEGETIPEIRFPGFTDAWEQRKFSDVVEIGSGMDYKHLGEGDIPVYGTGGYMLSVDAALSEDKDAIGIGRKGTIDKPYILRAPFWTVDTLFYCIPKDGYDLDFTSCLFQNVDWKKKDESTGVPSLSKVIINNVETAVPSYGEQRKIGDYFKGLDNLITLHQRKCDGLKELKKYMLAKMFPVNE